MNRLRSALVLAALLAKSQVAQKVRTSNDGLSEKALAPLTFSPNTPDFGLRLDKTQKLDFMQRRWDKLTVVMIVQDNGTAAIRL